LALNASIDPWFYLRYDNGWIKIASVVSVILMGFYFTDLYEDMLALARPAGPKVVSVAGRRFLFQALVRYSKSPVVQSYCNCLNGP
jgi:hypothetical protein